MATFLHSHLVVLDFWNIFFKCFCIFLFRLLMLLTFRFFMPAAYTTMFNDIMCAWYSGGLVPRPLCLQHDSLAWKQNNKYYFFPLTDLSTTTRTPPLSFGRSLVDMLGKTTECLVWSVASSGRLHAAANSSVGRGHCHVHHWRLLLSMVDKPHQYQVQTRWRIHWQRPSLFTVTGLKERVE